MTKKTSVGIDIGTNTTRVTVIEWSKGNEFPSILGTGSAETNGMRSGCVINPKNVVEGIKRAVLIAEKSSGIKIRNAYISIEGINLKSEISSGSSIVTRADKEITHLDILKAISESEENLDTTNKKIIQTIPIEYKIDGKEFGGRPEGMKGLKLEVKTLFITCLKQNIEDLVASITEAGIDIIDIIASPMASSSIVLSEKQKVVGCALLDIGSETVSLSVFENNNLLSLQIFSIGGIDITKDIALGFRISIEEAESLKVGSVIGDYSKKKVDEIIEARLKDIFELVENHLKRLKRNGLLPAGVIMIGGGSYVNKIEEIAKSQLKIPARIGPTDSFVNSKYKVRDLSWYTSVGLALSYKNNPNEIFSNSTKENIKQIKGFFKSFLSQLIP